MENKIDIHKITNIELSGVDMLDYPDFSDAYVLSADYEGEEMTEDQLNKLNDIYRDFIYEEILKQIN